MTKNALEVKNLTKSFGDVKVLRGINFSAKPGTILALLGPNGAGKTTTIHILSTLLKPDAGEVHIMGYDVVKQPEQVHACIGLTGQYAAVDEYLTGEENLHLMGGLYRLSKEDTKRRTKELLEQFDLVGAAKRPVKTYSGGMKRRIDLAMSLIAMPPVIFLDEPTTGLDPRSRLTMWEMIKQLAKYGTTILLTTQYMDEADQLADNIVVIDNGKVIAEGTSASLKSRIGSDRLELTISINSDFEKAKKVLTGNAQQADLERRAISIAGKGGARKVKELLQNMEDEGIEVETISLQSPTLDDVFLTLTGHAASSEKVDSKKAKKEK